MDKTNHNTDSASVGAAMVKATAEKESEVIKVTPEPKIVVGDIPFKLDIPNQAPMIFKDISIYGYQLVSPQFLHVVKFILMSDDFLKENVVDTIVFSENQPVYANDDSPIFAGYRIEDKTIGINLQHHFDAGVALAKSEDGLLSIRCHIWYNMLMSVVHELYHGLSIATDTEAADPKELEEFCAGMADEYLTEMFRDYAAEPPGMCHEPFFGPRYMELYIREIKDGTDSWQEIHKCLHDEANVYWDMARNEFISNFRTWVRFTYGADVELEDARWDADPKDMLIGVDDPPPFNADTEAQVIVPEAVPDAQVVEAKPVVSSLAGGHGVDEEAIAMSDMDEELGGESNAYVMEDYDMLPAEAAGFNAQQSRPVERVQTAHVVTEYAATGRTIPATPAANTFCSGCGNPTTAGMKFCGRCGTAIAATEPVVHPNPATTAKWDTPVTEQVHTQPAPEHQPERQYNQQLRTNLPNPQMGADEMRTIVEEVMFRAYSHLFNKCGYGVMARPAFDETQKWAILEPIYVGDIPRVNEVLLAHDITEGGVNRNHVAITDGYIRGKCTKKGLLPSYTIYFNANGSEIKRVLLPQNPWKETNGVYSKPAGRAQQGALICWIMDASDALGFNDPARWRGRIENSAFIWTV